MIGSSGFVLPVRAVGSGAGGWQWQRGDGRLGLERNWQLEFRRTSLGGGERRWQLAVARLDRERGLGMRPAAGSATPSATVGTGPHYVGTSPPLKVHLGTLLFWS
jgi:hypothetical protein